MIRGVKKQIIEVLNTENKYFERAILVVSDEYNEFDRLKLDKKAKEYISVITPDSLGNANVSGKCNDKVSVLLSVLKYLFFIILGAVSAYFMLK